MSQFDYSAPVKYEPPPSRPKRGWPPFGVVFCIVLILLTAVVGGYLVFSHVQRQKAEEMLSQVEPDFTPDQAIPAAAVLTGAPFEWRELAAFDWEAGIEHPRPVMTVGDFTADGADDVLLIDFAGPTRIIQLGGETQQVGKAHWDRIAYFLPWDMDGNGVCELVPGTLGYSYEPEVKSWVRIGGKGGG